MKIVEMDGYKIAQTASGIVSNVEEIRQLDEFAKASVCDGYSAIGVGGSVYEYRNGKAEAIGSVSGGAKYFLFPKQTTEAPVEVEAESKNAQDIRPETIAALQPQLPSPTEAAAEIESLKNKIIEQTIEMEEMQAGAAMLENELAESKRDLFKMDEIITSLREYKPTLGELAEAASQIDNVELKIYGAKPQENE